MKYAFAAVIALVPASLLNASPLFTERVSVNPTTGAEPDGSVGQPALSADGCTVVFVSDATTLADPKFGISKSSPQQIYAVDRCSTPHTMELISVTNDGVSFAAGYNQDPIVSADGRYVAFYSNASNLPNGGNSSNPGLIFIRDRSAHTTVSPLEFWRSSATLYTNKNKPYMSGDAKYFALDFVATGVPHNLYRFDLSTTPPTLVPVCPSAAMTGSGECENAVISADGSTIAFDTEYPILVSDTNATDDIYTFSVNTSSWALAGVNADGTIANDEVAFNGSVALSDNGQIVVFHNFDARNLTGGSRDILIKDFTTGALNAVNQEGDVSSMDPPSSLSASGDGTRVGFTPNTVYPLVHFRQDAIVFDGPTQRLVSVCRSSYAVYGNAGCAETNLSADGNWAVYTSYATNLVPGTTNTIGNVFVSAVSPNFDLVFTDGFESAN